MVKYSCSSPKDKKNFNEVLKKVLLRLSPFSVKTSELDKTYYFLNKKIFKKKKSSFELLCDITKQVNLISERTKVIETTQQIQSDIMDNFKSHFVWQGDKLNLLENFATKEISKIIACNLSVSKLHQSVFPQYKDIYKDKCVVLVATGPSLQKYVPFEEAIHIGVNSAFKQEKVKLDYLFMLDYLNVKNYIEQANEYEKLSCKKFYGLFKEPNHVMHIPETEAIKANAHRYYINNSDFDLDEIFNYDIENNTLGCFWSVIFQAAQFALYTNPKKIYLVGCDCTNTGHFDGTNQINTEDLNSVEAHAIKVSDGWNKFKKFASLYYPRTEIISINPVGLKGLFKDVYTEREECQ